MVSRAVQFCFTLILTAPTDIETAQAREAAREEYLAVLLIRFSNPKRYLTLIVDLQNNHTHGTDQYPNTIAKAYDTLVHYRNPSRQPRMDRQDMGMSFYNEDDDDDRAHTYQSQGDQHGRGGGKGCGCGNRGRGSRGNNQGRGNHGHQHGGQEQTTHLNEHEGVQQDSQPTSNTSDVSAPYSPVSNTLHIETHIHEHGQATDRSLLLDSCSLTNLISNPKLLHNIHTVDRTLTIRCNAGNVTTNQMGYLGDYPEAVWYNPAGIANILSQANITQHYCITMDTARGNFIKVHCAGLPPLVFTPSHNGLYQYTPTDNQQFMTMWTHINTVTQNAEKYTQRAYKRAAKARRFQNIIMRPGSRELMDVSIKHLANCPITCQDVLAADDIFGPNLGSLKGKTVH